MGVEIPELCPGRVFDMCNALEMESQRAFRIIMLLPFITCASWLTQGVDCMNPSETLAMA